MHRCRPLAHKARAALSGLSGQRHGRWCRIRAALSAGERTSAPPEGPIFFNHICNANDRMTHATSLARDAWVPSRYTSLGRATSTSLRLSLSPSTKHKRSKTIVGGGGRMLDGRRARPWNHFISHTLIFVQAIDPIMGPHSQALDRIRATGIMVPQPDVLSGITSPAYRVGGVRRLWPGVARPPALGASGAPLAAARVPRHPWTALTTIPG